MDKSKPVEFLQIIQIIGSFSAIIVLLFSVVFVLGGGYTKLDYLWKADIPTKIEVMGEKMNSVKDSIAELKEDTKKNTEILNRVSLKVDDLWEYRKTRTMELEELVLDFSKKYSGNPHDFVYTNSFLFKMKSDDIKEILDSSASHAEKIFTIIEKVGGVERLAKLLETEDLLKSFGVFVSFVEQYN
jgi:hypothetical protein